MKHEMRISSNNTDVADIERRGRGVKGGIATCVDARKHTDKKKKNQFHGRADSRQNVAASGAAGDPVPPPLSAKQRPGLKE